MRQQAVREGHPTAVGQVGNRGGGDVAPSFSSTAWCTTSDGLAPGISAVQSK